MNYFKTFILITSICAALMACANPAGPDGGLGKNTDTSDNDNIIGRWRWVQSIGGIAGITVTPESFGRTEMLEFDDNNQLMQYVNGNLSIVNNYRLGADVTYFRNDTIPVIYLDDVLYFGYTFEDNNSLILSENVLDGFAKYYERE